MTAKQEIKKRRQTAHLFHRIQIILFMAVLLIGGIIGLLIPIRPEISEQENRKLTEFPDFTFSGFLNGDYFSGISTWYADTYPFRDTLMAGSQAINRLHGLQTTQLIGTNTNIKDEIPEIPDSPAPAPTDPPAEETTTPKPAATEKESVSVPDGGTAIEDAIRDKIQNNLYIANGAAYSIFYFNKEASNTYADAMSSAADRLKGTTDVYSILLPDSTGAILDKSVQDAMGCSSEQDAIAYTYYLMNENVKTVPVFDTLREHRNEYIFFRTDHHWTQLGAYYAYRQWAAVKGVESHDKDSFQTKSFSGFLGSYYQSTNSSELQANADTVETWIPNGTNKMSYTMTDGTTRDWYVINDVSNYQKHALYSCFIAGDNPYSVIKNPKIKDGSSCVVVKESYGNAFVPWLVDHYQTIYVLDFRYYDGNFVSFAKEKKANDLIFINAISLAGSSAVAKRIAGLVQ